MKEKLKVLDLFSGIGGFSLGLERAGMETVAFCEIDKFCQKVLRKHWPDVPIHNDIRTLNGHKITANVVCGGFPCQPVSYSGRRLGENDDRWLWPHMLRVISEVNPDWVIGENVIGLDGMGLDEIIDDLEAIGYEVAPPFEIPACAAGAHHERYRIWIIANAVGERRQESRGHVKSLNYSKENFREADRFVSAFQRDIVPYLCNQHDGVPKRLAESGLKALGNAVVPQIPEIIGKAILSVN